MFSIYILSMVIVNVGCASTRLPNEKPVNPDPFIRTEPAEEKDSPNTFQSDIILTPQQRAEIEGGIQRAKEMTGHDMDKRKAITRTQYLWPRGRIPYRIHSTLVLDTDLIKTAIARWEEQTCLLFHERTDETDYVNFFRGDGCFASLGRIGGEQYISIGEGCTEIGTIVHEIGHILGFHHEQARPDRDDYITIHHENIAPGKAGNFVKYSWYDIVTHQVPYDYGSLMHYGPYYFSENGEATITADSPMNHIRLGNRDRLSFADVKLANIIYECGEFGDTCDDTSVTCQNNGYVGPECTCVCPDGFTGSQCENVGPDTGCIRHETSLTGVIESPNYPHNYDNYDKCLWHIRGIEGSNITVTFKDFFVELDTTCDYDWVQIRTKAPFITGGEKYCGSDSPGIITSSGNEMVVEFAADFLFTETGFRATWKINEPVQEICPVYNGCGVKGPITDSCATIVFGPYQNQQKCNWDIRVDKGYRIALTLEMIDIQDHQKCRYDQLSVQFDRVMKVAPLWCGSRIPKGPIVSTANTMKLAFKSNKSKTGKGFIAHHKTIKE